MLILQETWLRLAKKHEISDSVHAMRWLADHVESSIAPV
jgi:hypothetical protein